MYQDGMILKISMILITDKKREKARERLEVVIAQKEK